MNRRTRSTLRGKILKEKGEYILRLSDRTEVLRGAATLYDVYDVIYGQPCTFRTEVEALYEEVWGKSGARIILAMIEEPGFFDEPWDRIYHQMRDEWVELLQRPKAETGDFTKIPGLFGHVSCAYAEGDIEYRKKCKQIIDKKEKQ